MAASWLRINESEYLNTNKVTKIRYLKSKKQYEITLTDKEVMSADTVEHATTFDITEEREE